MSVNKHFFIAYRVFDNFLVTIRRYQYAGIQIAVFQVLDDLAGYHFVYPQVHFGVVPFQISGK